MKTHIIKDGIVINTIVASVEEAKVAFPDALCIEATTGGVGWSYIEDQLFSPFILNEPDVILRQRRNVLLTETDWTQLPDVPATIREAYMAYRQALRDISKQEGFPDNIIWPIKP
jgi:hypothetical protein